MQKQLSIMGIILDHRADCAPRVQEVLTQYGTMIIYRTGSPDPSKKEDGLITITLDGEKHDVKSLAQDLEDIQGVTVNYMQMR